MDVLCGYGFTDISQISFVRNSWAVNIGTYCMRQIVSHFDMHSGQGTQLTLSSHKTGATTRKRKRRKTYKGTPLVFQIIIFQEKSTLQLYEVSTMEWVNVENLPPPNEPICGYRGDRGPCATGCKFQFLLVIVSLLALLCYTERLFTVRTFASLPHSRS